MSNITDLLSKASGSITDFDRCVKRWQDLRLVDTDDYHLALENFKIVFTYNSNAIENINLSYHTTRDVYEEKTVTFTGSPSDLFAVSNQNRLFDVIIDDVVNHVSISPEDIKRYHSILMAGCYDSIRWSKGERPGEFKKNDYCVGLTNEGSLPEDVYGDLNYLLYEVLNTALSTNDDKLKMVAYFHLKFEQIHPFADGNGRLGRNIINLLLMQLDLPPIVIYNEDKETYYMALEVFDRTGNIDGFVKFLKEEIVRTWTRRKDNLEE